MRPLYATAAVLLAVSAGGAAGQEWHFKPQGHGLGDVHPFFANGECQLYYLKPEGYHAALARSSDWLHWKETPLTHAPTGPDDWMSPYFVLGVFHDPQAGLYRSFYGHAEGRMVSSTSADLIHWSCAPKAFHIPPQGYYKRRRDPFVFWIPETKEYGCVMTAWIKDKSKEAGGAVSLATSPDLKQWKDHGPILHPGNIGEPECPQMFRMGARWYLLASIYDRAVGQPVYWMSGSPLGPWPHEPAGMLDGKDLCAAQIAFDGGTPVLFGWIPLNPARPGKQTWGGHLALPREVHALPDGRLATRLPGKITERLARLDWKTHPSIAISDEAHEIAGAWTALAAEFTLEMPEGVKGVRLVVPPLGSVVLQRELLRVLDADGECWSELPAELPADRPMSVALYIESNMVELFVDGRYSLAARLPAKPGSLSLRVEGDASQGSVTGMRTAAWKMPR